MNWFRRRNRDTPVTSGPFDVGVDGPGWMVRGVAVTNPGSSGEIAAALRDIMRGTIVVRGTDDLPDRTPLPITLPDEIARHL